MSKKELTWDDISVRNFLGISDNLFPFFDQEKENWRHSCTNIYTMLGFLESIDYPIKYLPNWVIEQDYPKTREQVILACHLIRESVGDPFKNFEISETMQYWEMNRVQSFAQGILESGKFEDVPGLSDLLEEHGCTNQELIRHFRQEVKDVCPCEHMETFGCWDCQNTGFLGWVPKPVPCNSKCWALRLILGGSNHAVRIS